MRRKRVAECVRRLVDARQARRPEPGPPSSSSAKRGRTTGNQTIPLRGMVPRGGVEPPTRRFSVVCSTTELPGHRPARQEAARRSQRAPMAKGGALGKGVARVRARRGLAGGGRGHGGRPAVARAVPGQGRGERSPVRDRRTARPNGSPSLCEEAKRAGRLAPRGSSRRPRGRADLGMQQGSSPDLRNDAMLGQYKGEVQRSGTARPYGPRTSCLTQSARSLR